ncbi:MAG: ABC transporter substrate-binding protein [Candidatus Izemoplasmatales bacterium]
MKKLLLTVFVLTFALVLVACGGTTTTETPTTAAPTTEAPTTAPNTDPVPIYETRVTNETYTLLLQSSTMDGVFSPYFYSSAYDGDVVGMTNVGLLTTDETGAVVASDYYPTVAQSYSIYYTDNLTTYAEKETYEEGDYVVYEMVIKNGAKFSDGTVIDADDVLYNYYVYLDPAYSGSSTLYTIPILGLGDYRTQVVDSASYAPLADAIVAADERLTGYTTTTAYTESQHDAYWAAIDQAGEAFAGEIVTYVKNNYLADNYVNAYFLTGATAADIDTPQLEVAFGMSLWGYGEISSDMLTFTGASGTVYNVADLTNAKYFEEILAANTVDDKIAFTGGYWGLADYESVGSNFVDSAKEIFTSSYASEGSVPNIAGLVKGTKTIDGEEFETVKVILTKQNPKAILSLGVTVAPQHYYTAGYTYPDDAIVNYGVEWNNPEFMEHLADYNGAPMGAGPYKFANVDPGDGTVNFVRNPYFETMGGVNVYNANIKRVALKIVSSGAEYSALQAGDVHYATVSATADVMEDIAEDQFLSILVDNLGYGYILLNPQVHPNLNYRIAITTVLDTSQVLNYYPNGLADLIYRSQSQVSWSYPEGATAIYPFDETLASAISYFEEAGVVFTDGVVSDFGGNAGSVEDPIIFTLPSGASAHPAGGVYLKAQTLLQSLGFTVEVKTDESLIANIKKSPVGSYALAWQSAQDPDMYQVYHYESQAESVISNGIVWLYENGDDDALGTIDVVKLDGTTVEMNQKEALVYLAELIEEGTAYMLPEERKPIYEKALEVLAQLNIEIPTYQRKNLFVADNSFIDVTTLSTSVTPYWGPMVEIWKVSFTENVLGNQTTEVLVGYED